MTTRSRIRSVLSAWRGVPIWVVTVIVALVLLSEGRVWFDRLAGVPEGDELLMTGLSSRNASWTEAALRQGASPNARDQFGNTPLMWAAQSGDLPIVRRLIAAGADVSAVSELMTPLTAAAMTGQLQVMEILLNAGAEANQHAAFQLTPLHQAAAVSHELAIALLLKHGADVDARNFEGQTPLIIAMYRDEELTLPCAKRLIQSGADVNAADAQGATALMAAASEGKEQLVNFLLESGADTAIRDARQQTASMVARSGGHDVLAKRLEPEQRAEVTPTGGRLE